MFDFGNSNNGQKEAISSANGPVLITAGPGTGKTYTLVQRAIYLIEKNSLLELQTSWHGAILLQMSMKCTLARFTHFAFAF